MKRDYGGPVLLGEGVIRDTNGKLVRGAQLDVWQTAPDRLCSSRNVAPDTDSLCALKTVVNGGRSAFTTVKPVAYTVPSDGPEGGYLERLWASPVDQVNHGCSGAAIDMGRFGSAGMTTRRAVATPGSITNGAVSWRLPPPAMPQSSATSRYSPGSA